MDNRGYLGGGHEVMRGPSIRDRANRYAQAVGSPAHLVTGNGEMRTQPISPSSIPFPMPYIHGQPSTPRTATMYGSPSTPRTAPMYEPEHQEDSLTLMSQGQASPSPALRRGPGSARRMIQQWEGLPSSPAGPSRPAHLQTPTGGMPLRHRLSREYLDEKPLPAPREDPDSTTPPYFLGSGPSNPRTRSTTPPLEPPTPTRLPLPTSPTYSMGLGIPPSPSKPFPTSPSRGPLPSPRGPQPQLSPLSPSRTVPATPPRVLPQSPSRVQFAPTPSPLYQSHLTPDTARDSSRTSPNANWSDSPEGKRRKGNGKSPLKEMFSAIGRKAKGKGRGSQSELRGYDIGGGLVRVGSNGLPGGIVFRDRMGDREMEEREVGEPGVIRCSSVLYLVPTPCSSFSPWGSWLTSWAALTPELLRVTYCPIFHQLDSGNDRRNSDPSKNDLPIPYATIPQPDPSHRADVELDMRDCVEVRSLRREEIRGRGIPTPPEGVGTEVLEMVWGDGGKRYIGVEGVSGRIGWVSSIWDVLLACKSEDPGRSALPPPSPIRPSYPTHENEQLSSPYLHRQPIDEPSPFRQPQEHTYQANPLQSMEPEDVHGDKSGAQPVQKIGDRWVAASLVGGPDSDVSSRTRKLQATPDALRNLVQKMFDAGPDEDENDDYAPVTGQQRHNLYMAARQHTRADDSDNDEDMLPPRPESATPGTPGMFDSNATLGVGLKTDSETMERIKAWQPTTEHELSIFARSPSRASNKSAGGRRPLSATDRDNSFKTTETGETNVSFDPSDLNPSRSASQVGRQSDTPRRRGAKTNQALSIVDENTPPSRHAEQAFSPRSEKSSKLISNEIGASNEDGSRGDTELSPMAERAFRTMAGKSLHESSEDHTLAASPKTSSKDNHSARNARRTSDAKPGDLPRSVQMVPSSTRSSETADSTTIRTPPEHDLFDRVGYLGHHYKDDQLSGSGGALSKLLPAYSDLNHSELGITMEKIGVWNVDTSPTEQIGLASKDLQNVIGCLTALVGASKALEDPNTLPKGLDDRLGNIQMDVKAIENALNFTALRLPDPEQNGEKGLGNIHEKLDAIARLCEDVLTKQAEVTSPKAKKPSKTKGALDVEEDPSRPRQDDVAQLWADLTGGSGTSPRKGGLQVLHNVSAPPSPRMPGAATLEESGSQQTISTGPVSDEVKKQVHEVLGLVKELKEARMLQTQQTTDIARYLNELNTWLEKFVQNSAVELSSMSKRLNSLVGSDSASPGPNGEPGERKPGLPDLVSEMHSMLAEQKKRTEDEGPVGQRLDGLLNMMGAEKERQAGQQGMVEQVLTILGRQRNDNEMLLRALANDLTSEIRGERIRFVEAMQQATSMNVTRHVEEFKKTLSAEVQKSIKELGKMREEKRALEHQIADLFALKAKFGGNSRRGSEDKPPPAWPQGPENLIQAMAAGAAGQGFPPMPVAVPTGRVLPAPPA